MYIHYFPIDFFSKNCKQLSVNIFIYTENDSESTKTHQKHPNTFSTIQAFKNTYFLKLDIHSNQRFPFIFVARLESTFLIVSVLSILKLLSDITPRAQNGA